MSDKVNVCSRIKLQYKGVFHLEQLYKRMKFWLDYEGYGDEKKNFLEERYVERIRGSNKQMEMKWICEKFINDYFSILITVDFLILSVKEIEVQKEGKKFKTNSAYIIMYFSSDLVKNRKNKYKDDGIFKKFYENVLVKSRIDEYAKDAYDKTNDFYNEVKNYLETSVS